MGATLDLGDAPGGTNNAVDQHLDILKSTSDIIMAVPKPSDQSEREKLIRRRWRQTGIKMWNPDVHGAGHAALNIQGRVELLPPKPGEILPGYDKLEFKLIGGRIVCEGVVVDPPNGQRSSQFAGAHSATKSSLYWQIVAKTVEPNIRC